MWVPILCEVLSECFLSLYPIFVKNIDLPIFVQMWSRFFSYVGISAAFIDRDFVWRNLSSARGLILSAITTVHIYVSYRGFQLLESGVAYTIFYLYPLMILLAAGENIHPIMFLAVAGVFLLSAAPAIAGGDKKTKDDGSRTVEGVAMILAAAATEAAIFFAVRGLKTANHWNHLFISYFAGAVLFSLGFLVKNGDYGGTAVKESFMDMKGFAQNNRVWAALAINAIIGLFGYLLRFFAMSNLPARIYAPLSYFGIFMSYVYGVLINGDKITAAKIAGTVLVLIPNIYFLMRGGGGDRTN